MKNRGIWMILACAVPLSLLAVLSFYNIKSNTITILAIAFMIIAHLVMMIGHKEH